LPTPTWDTQAVKPRREGKGWCRRDCWLAVVAFLPRIISHLRQGSTLSIDELRQRMSENIELLVLDVRSAEDYQGELGHIIGTRNIPLEELETCLPELAPNLEKPIALVCTTDRRSKKAAQILGKEGFADVHVILGGMTQWNKDALPVNTGTKDPSPIEETQ
jgi:rhodanese-related sulfurtransferase